MYIRHDTDLRQIILDPDEELAPTDDVKIYFEFHGMLNDNLNGYNKTLYKENEQEHCFALTNVPITYLPSVQQCVYTKSKIL